MAQFGYGQITPDGWLGFKEALQQEPWSQIEDLPIATPEDRRALAKAPCLASQKALLRITLEPVALTLKDAASPLEEADKFWDGFQRELHFTLLLTENGRDASKRAIAARLRKSLLEGGALKQTGLTYKEEVDFGRRQVEVAREPEIRVDIEALGVGDLLDGINQATIALDNAIKAAPDQTRALSILQATRVCARVCNAFHNQLIAYRDALASSPERDLTTALIDNLDAFVNRF